MGKGAGFEREISKRLSQWWSEGKRDDIFYRSQASGARYTVRQKSGKDTALQGGDITCSDPDGKPLIKAWNIEDKTGYCKKNGLKNADGSSVIQVVKTKYGTRCKEVIQRDRWDVLDLIDSKQEETMLEVFWQQCLRDSVMTDRIPILIFRRFGREACIAMEYKYFIKLVTFFGTISDMKAVVVCIDSKCCLSIVSLDDFFDWIPNIRAAL